MPDFGRVAEHISALVEFFIGSRLDYHALYPAQVVSQNGDGTLEVLPDDERVRGFGLGSVAIRTGAPGYKYTVSEGARCLIGFEAADPTRPYAALWDSETSVDEIEFDGGSEDVARTSDSIEAGHFYWDSTNMAFWWAPDLNGLPGTYLPPGALPPNPNHPLPPSPGTPGIPMTGTITSGNDKLKA